MVQSNNEKKIKIDIEPIGKRIILDGQENGLKAIIGAGIGLKSICAGKGTCGKCRIIIHDDVRPPVSELERKALSSDEIEHGIRLACQQIFSQDLSIYIPSSSLTEEQKLLLTGAEELHVTVEPVIKKYFLNLKPPAIDDLHSDYKRLKKLLAEKYGAVVNKIDKEVLKSISAVLRRNGWSVTVSVRDGEIIAVEDGDREKSAYGIAVDLGTTKIAVLLVDLKTGKNIDKKGIMNPQISFGEDVMSRINYAMQDRANLEKIRSVVVENINKTIEDLAAKNSIRSEEIIEMTLVGNTAMHHLFLGLDVKQLGLSPFVAVTSDVVDIKARDAGINISPGAYIYLLPVVAGFIGSDHMAMILASGIEEQEGNIIGIDIGTNTEIVLKSKKGMESVSTASGPAFEGAHIRFGMRAAPGAIERVIIDKKTCIPQIQTIDDRKPVGICGSGILDTIAEMLKAGIINSRGKFNAESKCICKDDNGVFQYILDPVHYTGKHKEEYKEKCNKKSENGKYAPDVAAAACEQGKISITQKDVVEIQLAKGAIRTGINILLESAGIDFKEIDKIIIAGAFGSYIDPKNTVDIGMFPEVDLKKIVQIGNAAAEGAKMVLISASLREKAEKIADMVKYLELTVFPTFTDNYVKSILFPGYLD